LKNAKEQSEAMANAKLSLEKVLANATAANAGYRPASVVTALDGGKPVANITLMKGEDIKKVTAKLD
jgi:hypothetical protein